LRGSGKMTYRNDPCRHCEYKTCFEWCRDKRVWVEMRKQGKLEGRRLIIR
jgi:hypothetical protein